MIAVVLVLQHRGEDTGRRIHASFAGALNLIEGAQVRVGGVPVGRVDAIGRRGDVADVRLRIDAAAAWPLHEGTRARIRYGSTVGYALRYVELTPGSRRAPALPAGARLPTADTTTPVEFDDLFDVFDATARRDLGALVDGGAATLRGRGEALASGLGAAAPALDQAAEVTRQLGEDPGALAVLVRSAGDTARALADRQTDLHGLVGAAAATYDELSAHADATGRTLARLPRTLDTTRGTLARVDRSLTGVDGLMRELRPGARAARSLSRPLAAATRTLGAVAPELDRTLRSAAAHGPSVSRFLTDARPLLRRLGPTLAGLAPMLACVRPYAPEIAGFFSTWHSFALGYDALGHYARANVQQFTFGDLATRPAAAHQQSDPDLGYAFLRPPGYLAGNPHFLPQCGAGREGLDATKDPEAR